MVWSSRDSFTKQYYGKACSVWQNTTPRSFYMIARSFFIIPGKWKQSVNIHINCKNVNFPIDTATFYHVHLCPVTEQHWHIDPSPVLHPSKLFFNTAVDFPLLLIWKSRIKYISLMPVSVQTSWSCCSWGVRPKGPTASWFPDSGLLRYVIQKKMSRQDLIYTSKHVPGRIFTGPFIIVFLSTSRLCEH